MKFKLFILLFSSLFLKQAYGQFGNYQIALDSVEIPNLKGVQSYIYGQYDGKILIIGGRLDGLHQRQPFASFDVTGNNTDIIVIDINNKSYHSAPLSSLNSNLFNQLSSTNMQFYQQDTVLYAIGGYGYSSTAANHITYSFLTAINIPSLMDAVINTKALGSQFRQISDTLFQLTGGVLKKIYDDFYLVGGHKFTGRYNPMGGPSFTQQYSNQIRVLNIYDDGTNLSFNLKKVFTDDAELHRRDYNMESQIFPDGKEGLTVFSGVFQKNADLPFLNSVNIDSSSYYVNSGFSQYYNHYHCAHLPVYDSVNKNMKTIFFGGISQYYDDNGILTQDNDVPFVNTIAYVERDSNWQMSESKLAIEMPGLLGSGSEFIQNENLAKYKNDVVKLNELNSDSILLGYIYGGIHSSASNIFFVNNGTQSNATNKIYKVYFVKNTNSTDSKLNENSQKEISLQVFPNPAIDKINILINIAYNSNIEIELFDINGSLIYKDNLGEKPIGESIIKINYNLKGIYILKLKTEREFISQKLIIN